MPSHRILLLVRRIDEIDFARLRLQVEALRRCAGVSDVVLGVPDQAGIRLLSPWLFHDPDAAPSGVDLGALGDDLCSSTNPQLIGAIARALWSSPLSVRPYEALRGSFSRLCLADPTCWPAQETASLAQAMPLLETPAVSLPYRAHGRIRAPDTGGPIRILALNAAHPALQTLLGRFIHELGLAGRQVELLDYREPSASMPLFRDGPHVRQLDPQATDPSAQPWHLVLLGDDLPFRVRQFSTLTARLWLFSRPAALFHDHRRVSVSLDPSRLLFDLQEDGSSRWHTLAAIGSDWHLTSIRNAELFSFHGSTNRAPLASLLTLAGELEARNTPFAVLAIADRFQQRFKSVPSSRELLSARQLAHRGYEPMGDPLIALALAREIGRLLAMEQHGALRKAAFARFLRRPADNPGDDGPISMRKRIDIIRGVVTSREYARITPPPIAAVTSRVVDRLHRAIFAGSPDGSLSAEFDGAEGAGAATAAACRAVVAKQLAGLTRSVS